MIAFARFYIIKAELNRGDTKSGGYLNYTEKKFVIGVLTRMTGMLLRLWSGMRGLEKLRIRKIISKYEIVL